MGLIKQIQMALNKYNILRLTQTFVTLSLNEMVTRAQFETAEQAESLILSMVSPFLLLKISV